jgi:hypothetical protein
MPDAIVEKPIVSPATAASVLALRLIEGSTDHPIAGLLFCRVPSVMVMVVLGVPMITHVLGSLIESRTVQFPIEKSLHASVAHIPVMTFPLTVSIAVHV